MKEELTAIGDIRERINNPLTLKKILGEIKNQDTVVEYLSSEDIARLMRKESNPSVLLLLAKAYIELNTSKD